MTQIVFEDITSTTDITDVKPEQTRLLFAAIPGSLFTVLVRSSILPISQWSMLNGRLPISARFLPALPSGIDGI